MCLSLCKEYENTVEGLAEWIRDLIEEAKADIPYSVSYFQGNEYSTDRFQIVGGWADGFSADYKGILLVSESTPRFCMSVKIIENEGPYASAAFDGLKVPTNVEGVPENICIALELDENAEELAAFFWNELERLTKEFEEVEACVKN